MNPKFLFLIFAGLAITALAMTIISDFWIPMLVGAAAVALLLKMAR